MNPADPNSSAFFYDRFMRHFPDPPPKSTGKRKRVASKPPVELSGACGWMNLCGHPLELYDTNNRLPVVRLKAITNMTGNVVSTNSGKARRIGGGRPDVIFVTPDKVEVNFPVPYFDRAGDWFDIVSLLDHIDRNPPPTEYMVVTIFRSFEYVLRTLRQSYGRRPFVCANASAAVCGTVDLSRVMTMRAIGMPLLRLKPYIDLLQQAQRGGSPKTAKRVLKIEEQFPENLRTFAERDFLRMLPSEVYVADTLIKRDLAKQKEEKDA